MPSLAGASLASFPSLASELARLPGHIEGAAFDFHFSYSLAITDHPHRHRHLLNTTPILQDTNYHAATLKRHLHCFFNALEKPASVGA